MPYYPAQGGGASNPVIANDSARVTTNQATLQLVKDIPISPDNSDVFELYLAGEIGGAVNQLIQLELVSGADVTVLMPEFNVGLNNEAELWSCEFIFHAKRSADLTHVTLTWKDNRENQGTDVPTPAVLLANSKTWSQQDTLRIRQRASTAATNVHTDRVKLERVR